MSVRFLAALPLTVLLSTSALAQQPFPAILEGHAILPAESFVEAPADAPADLKVSGKFTTGKRIDAIGTIEGTSGDRPTGVKLPFRGQPLQGHSGIKSMGDGTFWVLTDNGFGSKATSPDSMLYLNRFRIDWTKGTVERLETVFLHDPDKKVPFRIANEATEKRYLTGSDFDTESFQLIGGKIWIGDEFGPYLIKADMSGKVEAVFETLIDGKVARSPDHYAVTTPAAPNGPVNFNIRRSKGFEGMAASKDGRFLYALLEGPVWDAETKQWENVDDREYLRIVEFDVAQEKWTGRHWKYVLDQNGLAIGDFNMIDATTGLIIERDNGEGTADKACPQGEKRPDCFQEPAKFKRVFKIELSDANVNKPVRKIGYIDLMQIADPNKKARKPLNDNVFTFPFFTIENVDVVDDRHIIVGNDNNLPFSSSRIANKQDDNEFILLEVGDFLKAR
ncbi:esterase-like activity of phytase family protein [Microvirga puerhi]|uniref:Esterase-like activity of phytase family protein n=1 Tax=Microvirga puerhi TaxID=2876078 RepID=A0ABS7VMW0_9HYPH|nr:esterase-like activity of phytase family protein [Microvirga puerhi]MBZ6076357.1 esterase-like activity of phytase family protein [Microvirga puerhi]